MEFVGRRRSLARLDDELDRVGPGRSRLVTVRGRRQVGKSRLVTEWLTSRGLPHVYYQALGRPLPAELDAFAAAVARSNVGSLAEVASGVTWRSWEAALAAFATADDGDGPPVLVIDEVPYLTGGDDRFEATLQAAWDGRLERAGILVVLIGSDLATMDALGSYGRPLYQRVDRQLRIDPLDPAEVGGLLQVDATEAIDTYLLTGGFPRIVAERSLHGTTAGFLDAACRDESHPLVYAGRQILDAELRPELSARQVLAAIGAGERAYNAIATRAGVTASTLSTALERLGEKRIVAADDPLAARRIGKRTRYRIEDPYLRFWLRFLADRVGDIERGRGDLVAADIRASWDSYAGVAVEPVVRWGIERRLPDTRFGGARRVGGFWSRNHDVEVDLVGVDAGDPVASIEFVGSIKWRTQARFGQDDAVALRAAASTVPGAGASTPTVAVSRTGIDGRVDVDVAMTPEDLLGAWVA